MQFIGSQKDAKFSNSGKKKERETKMSDEMTETTKVSEMKCPKCGCPVEETRNAVAFIEACTKCNWRNTGLFL
jgi:hypothetical protein